MALLAPAEAERALDDLLASHWLADLTQRLAVAWPYAGRSPSHEGIGQRIATLLQTASQAHTQEARHEVDAEALRFLEQISTRPTEELATAGGDEPTELADDDFRAMAVPNGVVERSDRDLGTPMWALQEGLRQVTQYNLARGRRDLKMLRGTRAHDGALWELRHRDGRHPVRVVYRLSETGPVVVAIMIKSDEDDQARVMARIAGW